MTRLGLALALLGAAACSDGVDVVIVSGALGFPVEPEVLPAPPDVPELFSMSHLVEVEVELAPHDWDLLRREGRGLVGVFTHSQNDYEYTYFEASVTIDGVRHENVGVRKKGYWESLSVVRPSLKVDLDHYDPGESHFGLEKLTLNNDRGDPSRTHECMAYSLFARAGLPASRCNLAHVVVNGQDLGTYSNVESVDKQMLARHFSDDDGNLYEGQVTDFTRADLDSIELKTNEKKNDRSDVLALVEALEVEDADLLERLGAVVDIDRFRDFWAMELLAGHWDGYSNNANNYLAYHDPESGRFQFLPWGTDNTFERSNPRGRVYAWGRVASRLYGLPSERQRFWDRFTEFNDTVWDAPALLDHIDQVAVFAPDAPPALLDQERQFITGRAARWRAALGGTAPRPRARGGMGPCEGMVSDISGTFSTRFGPAMASVDGPTELDARLSLDGEPVTSATWSGQAAMEPGVPQQVPGIRWVGTLPNDREITLQLYVEPGSFAHGSPRFHGVETYGIINVRDGRAVRYTGRIGDGHIELAAASTIEGAPVRGSFEGHVYQVGCAWR